MKIVIISAWHGNFDALEALPETYNELWVLGDLVNYGPEPAAVVDFVKANGSILVRGNHDHSIGYDEDPHCSLRFRKMADVTHRYTASVLNQGQKQFLKALPLHKELRRQNTRFYLCHAKPSDPLYGLPGRFSRLDRRSPGGIRGCPAGRPYPCALCVA
jgi:predicted phosphodiesterase